jgi:phosphatidylserine/phosphatidylglycerophosphate/cardiolipin synthase-like enzyme
MTGSFNFTKAAEDSNAENLLVIRGQPDLAREYVANYDAHRAHSQAYEPPQGTEGASETRPAEPTDQQGAVQLIDSEDSSVCR